MKKYFICLFIIYGTSVLQSQSVNVLDFVVDFECAFIDYDFIDFGGTATELDVNPSTSGINISPTVGRSLKTSGAQTWAGTVLTLEDPIDFSQGEVFKLKVYSPKPGITILFKLENLSLSSTFNEISSTLGAANTWQELTFDFSTTNASTKSLQKVVVFFDFGVGGDGSSFYFDDLNQVGNTSTVLCQTPQAPEFAAPSPAPCDNVLAIFSDAFTELPGTNFNPNPNQQTNVTIEDIGGNNMLKYDNFDLQRIAFQNALDISGYTDVHMDIWSPGATQVNFNLTNPGPVEAAYMINLVPGQWNSIDIPLSAFSGVVNLSNVIRMKFDNGDDLIYFVDNIYFYGDCNVIPTCPVLVWEDNFTGTSLDNTKWSAQIGDGCPSLCDWGNSELQYYRNENAVVSGGTLKIIAKEESFGGKSYTSARLRTKGTADFTYGRFEASIKMPIGQGIWPAFWMLSTDEPYGFWPQSGELDIVEVLGQEPELIHGTIHYGPPWPNNQSSSATYRLNSGTFNDDFHEYAIEWDEEEIRWYVDDILYSTKTIADVSPNNWPFDHEYHMLLNMAVGGNWPGSPDASTSFPQIMEVDYVRVYEGEFAYISGAQQVDHMATGEIYSVGNAGVGATYNWSVPAGASIVSGQGTNTINVDWGDSSSTGSISVNVNGCTSQSLSLDVIVLEEVIDLLACVLENFDDPAIITYQSSVGVMEENVTNPTPNTENPSSLAGKYTRSAGDLFDNMTYSIDSPFEVGGYVSGDTKFYIDILTSAPVGTSILLQLEDGTVSTPTNYPSGRHSRYAVETTKQNEWETLAFDYADRPDASVLDANVDQILLLFNPNSFTSDIYYFDNLEKHCVSAPAVITAKVCGGSTGVVNVLPGGMSLYTFFLDTNANGTMDQGEQVQIGSNNQYSNSSITTGTVVGVILEDLYGCTQTVTTTATFSPSDYIFGGNGGLTGMENGSIHYETNGAIESRQTIGVSADVDYDSATNISLLPSFETLQGAQFHAYIDGCN